MSLDHFKVDKGLKFRPRASAPSNPVDGDVYYDSTLGKFRFYQDGAWLNLGSGNVEQGLLFQLLADNNMENLAFGNFDGETTDIIQTATNMTLNQGEGQYTPDEVGDFRLWSGSRFPQTGPTGTTFTDSVTGATTVDLTTNPNELTIIDAIDGLAQYNFDYASTADDLLYIDWTLRIPSWTTFVTSGGDALTYVGLQLRDGARILRVLYVREGGSTGERQIKLANGSDSSLTDINGNEAVFNVDWSQEHKYELVSQRGGIAHLYVDGQLAITVDLSTSTSTSADNILWGSFSSSAAVGTHVWREFNFRRFKSYLETKVLNYRGSFAFEGDGTPTAATSAGTIQEITGSNDLFTEDNWDAADSGVTTNTTVTTVNAGEPNARLQGVVAGSGRHFYRWDLDTDTNLGANPYISARVKLTDVDNVSQASYNFLGMQLDNHDIRLVGEYVDADTFDLKLAGNTIDVSQETVGEPFRLTEGEEAVLELRKVNDETIQFLVNGQVQQECPFDVFGGNPNGNRVFLGLVNTIGGSDSLTWQWSEVRIGDSDAESYLPKNPIQEAIAVLDLDANVSTWISLSSDGGVNWTAPKKINLDGSSPLISIPSEIAGGKIKARILSYGNDDARINNFALLYNSSANSGGLGTQFVHTFDSSDFSSEPGDQILEHNLKAAEDELLLFGGTEFLTKDLDWFHVDSDRILIKNAVSGVPYEVRRIGFNFGETKNTVVVDRENKEAVEAWRDDFTPVVTAGGSMTVSNLNVKKFRYRRIGTQLFISARLEMDLGGSADDEIRVTLPIPAKDIVGTILPGETHNTLVAQKINGAPLYDCFGSIQRGSPSQMEIFREGQVDHSLGTAVDFVIQGFYEVDEENGYFEQVVTNVSNVGNNDTGVLTVQRKNIDVLGETQENILSADISTNGTYLTDLEFTGLEIGARYICSLQAFLDESSGEANLNVYIEHDGNDISRSNQNNFSGETIRSSTVEFEATATNLRFRFEVSSGTGFVRGNSTKNFTWAQLTKIDTVKVVESVEGRTSAKTQDLDRAEDGNPGILDYYNEEIIDLAGSGDFTGGKIVVTRVNNVVTITSEDVISYASNSSPNSAVGVIPTWARPQTTIAPSNLTTFGGSFVIFVRVDDDGTLGINSRDWSGNNTSLTNTVGVISLSYVISNF